VYDPSSKWEGYKRDTFSHDPEENNHRHRLFTYVFAGSATFGSVWGGKELVIAFLDSMNPSAAVKALANIEVKLSSIEEGTSQIVSWRGKPLFIRHRTQEEIQEAIASDGATPDPEADKVRVKSGKDEWLVVIGICTHLGCIPLVNQGDYKGWFCPCHGSHYDTSGRIRKGPAPRNLEVPPYYFLDDETLMVGKDTP